jgi:tetratricopeptide (TPR) repeat protein
MNLRILFVAVACAISFVDSNLAAGFPEGSPKFETSLSAAFAQAKKSSKPVAVVFSAAWCGPCLAMKERVYPSPLVKPFHNKLIWVYLDIDKENDAIDAKKYKVVSIPHIEFLDPDGTSISKQVGGLSAERFATLLAGIVNPPELDTAGYAERGNRKYGSNDYAGAVLDYDKAIELNPGDASAYCFRGSAKDDLQDYAGAILDYNKAIELNPRDASVYFNRGIANDDFVKGG